MTLTTLQLSTHSLTQSFLSENRYLLDSCEVSPRLHSSLIKDGMERFGLNPQAGVTYDPRTCRPIVAWMVRNAWVEPSLYDHAVPPEHVTPIAMYDGDLPWKALTWCYAPHECTQHDTFSHPSNIAKWMREKDEPYLMKSMLIDNLEIGWLCYCELDGLILIHHLQLRGTLKHQLSYTDTKWLYRFMVAEFLAQLPQECRRNVVLPTIDLYDRYTTDRPEYLRIPSAPYTSRVLAPCGFSKVAGSDLAVEYNHAMHQLNFSKCIPLPEQTYWRYTK